MEKKGLIILLLSIVSFASAQEMKMRDVFANMPDSIAPYLTRNNRLDMIDFQESSMKAEVDNSLGGKSRLDTLTANYLHLTLNEATTMEMKLLASSRLLDDTTKTIVCVATTYSNVETCVEFYTSKWHRLNISLDYDRNSLIACPDTMSATNYQDLSRLASDYHVVAKLSPETSTIELTPTFPNINDEDYNKINAIKRKIILKYDDTRLNFLNN